VDFEGKQVWHHSFGEIRTLHGTACSPLLYRDRVIVYQECGKPGSFVAAFDRKTGKQLWSTPRKASVGWGSPAAIRAGDRDEIIVSSQHRVTAYDPDSGKELWTCGGNLDEVTPSPVVGHGMLFCCSGRQGPTLAITPGGSGDVTKTHVVWKENRDSPFIPLRCSTATISTWSTT
jgi:outer membrane protein assembly factor BamB